MIHMIGSRSCSRPVATTERIDASYADFPVSANLHTMIAELRRWKSVRRADFSMASTITVVLALTDGGLIGSPAV